MYPAVKRLTRVLTVAADTYQYKYVIAFRHAITWMILISDWSGYSVCIDTDL